MPGTDRSCLLAAKRYRSAEHRMFHRDSGYLEGRRVRESRDTRAMASRTSFGREMIAQQWAIAEFAALSQMHGWAFRCRTRCRCSGPSCCWSSSAIPTARPRPGWPRPARAARAHRAVGPARAALLALAGLGLAHGDLSAYNLLVHDGRLVLIDVPQVIDVIANPRGAEFLDRDAANVAKWFTARGLAGAEPAPGDLAALLRAEARVG